MLSHPPLPAPTALPALVPPARLKGAWILLVRHLRVWRRRALLGLGAELAAPAALVLGLFAFGGASADLAPALVVSAAALAAGLEAGLGGRRRLVHGPLPELLLSTPLGLGSLLAAELAFALVRASLCGLVIAATASALGWLTGPRALAALGAGLAASAALASLGLLAAALARGPDGVRLFLAGVLLPCLVLHGAWFPLAHLPAWAGLLAQVNPVTHALGLLEPDPPGWRLGLSALVLGAYVLGPLLLARLALVRRLEAGERDPAG
jgi:lipooligosaccharide transport system permease protein